jgi:citrate lyase subunit beta / citryl-CoA lyase
MIRSLLYVPANSERFVAKAHERGADAIILDLEDSVSPAEKLKARANLTDAVPAVGRHGAHVFVRINSSAELAMSDAQAACRAGAFGLFVTKARVPAILAALASSLEPIERERARPPLHFVAMIEDPGAVFDARAIAAATPRVLAMLLGGEDIATAMGAEPTPEVLRFPKLMVHLAAKAAGVLSWGLLRTVADYRDRDAIVRAVHEARDFGFDGASCIHPSVVPILNEAFMPAPAKFEEARLMLAEAERVLAEGRGAFVYNGRMVDEPILARARALLRRRPDT